MALSEGFTDCNVCGSTEDVERIVGGRCLACAELEDAKGGTVEVPKEVLRKLISMSKSRHPTVCNEDAPRFENVLKDKLLSEEA